MSKTVLSFVTNEQNFVLSFQFGVLNPLFLVKA